MIFDKIENASLYFGIHKNFKKAFEFILNNDLKNIETGKHELGEGLFANVQELCTKNPDEAKFEAHRKYIDIQYVISGKERMDCALLDNFSTEIEYDDEADVEFLKLNQNSPSPCVLNVSEGQFAIFYPQDCHAPMLACGNSQEIKKVIVKIPLD